MASFPLLVCALLSIIFTTQAEVGQWPTKIAKECDVPSSNRTLFRDNLNVLLSQLNSTDSSSYIAGFNHTTAGVEPNKLYGLFLCRADISSGACRACVATASQRILQDCPGFEDSVIWYDVCMLTYCNEPIYGKVRTTSDWIWWDGYENNSMPIKPQSFLNRTLNELIPKAANTMVAGKKFAVNQTSFTESDPLYILAQCTPDLTPDQCNSCLQIADNLNLPRVMDADVIAVLQSCTIRYAGYQFYNETALEILSSPPAAALAPPASSSLSTGKIVAIAICSSLAVVLLLILCFGLWNRSRSAKETRHGAIDSTVAEHIKTAGQYDFAEIEAATNNFSAENKLGEGGFGVVYKGVFCDGQEVAVKRLFHSTNQGIEEFKNEANVVVKLQHRNLVQLLGFCVEKGEKILVFEYMPNKSLDNFLVDSEHERGLLDWPRRYSIVSGIAQGMLYLHEYSRLRIIHRDLKAANILLDANMQPKISDFGMAKIVGFDQSRGTASRVVGTLGYMPPEYLRTGRFSVKSDIFSFGLLILEIIAGKKNSYFYDPENGVDLPSHAWRHWNAGMPMEVLDPILRDSCSIKEVIRCIHISLLCLQRNPEDRPTISMIDEMLKNFTLEPPDPQPPAFFNSDGSDQPYSPEIIVREDGKQEVSVENTAITILEAR